MSKKIYNHNKLPPVIDKTIVHTKGWYRDLRNKVNQLDLEFTGLRERVKSVIGNMESSFAYQDGKGIPACYKRDFLFRPEEADITLEIDRLYKLAGSQYGAVPQATQPVNFILHGGRIYSITIPCPGDGVFVAKYFTVQISHRWWQNRTNQEFEGELFRKMTSAPISFGTFTEVGNGVSNVARIIVLDNLEDSPSIEWFWNLIDRRSGRKYADDFLSCRFLLPPGSAANSIVGNMTNVDGYLFEFDVPWVFERDTEIEFEFRPIVDVVQLAAASAVLPFDTLDDRENGTSLRNNSVLVRAELHGTKFLNKQDALKYGASFTP